MRIIFVESEYIEANRYRVTWGPHVVEIEAPDHDEAIALTTPHRVATVIRDLQAVE